MKLKISVDDKEHAFCGQNKINRFRRENRFCDFIIKVGSEEIHVHRNVICSQSDYFDAMFTHDTEEKRTGVVELKDVDRDCTVKCVDFMYTGKTCVWEEKCGDLIHVGAMFQLPTLCKAITDFLEEKLHLTTFFSTRRVAYLYDCQKLLDVCNDFAIKNFQQIVQLEEFKHLDKEYIDTLVGSKDAKVSDGAKCKAVMEWIRQDPSNRQTYLPELLEKIDFTKIQLSYRRFLFENEPLIQSSCECITAVGLSIFKDFRVKKKDFELKKSNTAPRPGIGVFDRNTNALQVYDVGEKNWTQKQELSNDMTKRFFSAVIFLDQHLYVFLDNRTVYRIFYSDPDAIWERRANKQLMYGPGVVLNGFIYTVNTMSDGEETWDVERYDPAADEWDTLPYRTFLVPGSALATSKGQVFCIGGFDNKRSMTIVEAYDPDSLTWTIDNYLNEARSFAAAATFEEGIYVMGGCGDDDAYDGAGISSVEYRCPATEMWTVLQPMKNARQDFCSWNFDGKIFAVGGDWREPTTIEQYDPETEEWKIIERIEGKNILSIASISFPMG